MPPRKKNAKVWNEDLVKALQARHDVAWRQGHRSAITFRQAALAIEKVRKDITVHPTDPHRLVNYPHAQLCATMDTLCRNLMTHKEPLYPAGYTLHTTTTTNPYLIHPYMKSIKNRGGALAILLALHVAPMQQSLTKEQICILAQPFCDEEMMENFHAGRMHGAWAAYKTLVKHELLLVTKGRGRGIPTTFQLSRQGELFLQALMETRPDIQRQLLQVQQQQTQPVVEEQQKRSPERREPEREKPASTMGIRNPYAKSTATSSTIVNPYARKLLPSPIRKQPAEAAMAQASPAKKRNVKPRVTPPSSELLFPDTSEDEDSIVEKNKSVAKKTQKTTAQSQLLFLDTSSEEEEEEACLQKKKPPLGSKQQQQQPIVIIDLSSDEEEDQCHTIETKKPAVSNLFPLDDEDSSSDEEIPPSVLKSYARTKTTNAPLSKKSAAVRKNKIKKEESKATLTPLFQLDLSVPYEKAIIYIDDRERNRNATPRWLRMELTRLFSTGLLSMAWSSSLPPCIVHERRLLSGDFSFWVQRHNHQQQLPVLVERKRVGDLVQRSTNKDHWYQLLRMKMEASVTVLLLEGDPRTAAQFIPQNNDDDFRSPFDHTIDEEESLYRFFARAVLNDRSRSIRFVQAKDEQSSLRMIGAMGLMALFATKPMENNRPRGDATAERICVRDRLHQGGLPFCIATRISDEIPSITTMNDVYHHATPKSRPRLFISMVKDLCTDKGTALGWSRAIHAIWHSKDSLLARERFDQVSGWVEDQALLLEKVHLGMEAEEAVHAVLGAPQLLRDTCRRQVHISLSQTDLFPNENGDTFYKIHTLAEEENTHNLSCITMQTKDGRFQSPKLHIYIAEGKDLVERVHTALLDDSNCVRAAKRVALDITERMKNKQATQEDQSLLLIRGFNTALDQAAKKADHIFESRVVAEMTLAELLVAQGIVTLQAIRLHNDCEMILQQLALACFHFHLLSVAL